MTTNDPAEVERIDVKPRLYRGITECMTAIHEGGDIYSVTSQSGREYAVDARDGRCTCPDAKYNLAGDEWCKHAFRIAVVRGERVIPAAIERGEVDPLLGSAVDTTPLAVATDGGQIHETHERPDDCGCWDIEQGLPCWPCYRDGFETPNPDR